MLRLTKSNPFIDPPFVFIRRSSPLDDPMFDLKSWTTWVNIIVGVTTVKLVTYTHLSWKTRHGDVSSDSNSIQSTCFAPRFFHPPLSPNTLLLKMSLKVSKKSMIFTQQSHKIFVKKFEHNDLWWLLWTFGKTQQTFDFYSSNSWKNRVLLASRKVIFFSLPCLSSTFISPTSEKMWRRVVVIWGKFCMAGQTLNI